jgi:beta-galactosidase
MAPTGLMRAAIRGLPTSLLDLKRHAHMLMALCLFLPLLASAAARQIVPMDSNWKFTLANPQNAEQSAFDDASWRTLDVPHDWSIAGPFAETNRTGGAGGYLPAGVGWYRKHFDLPADDAQRHVFIDFDGVMANSDVWINGFHLGKRPFGYVSFRYELTGHLKFGHADSNVLAVRADNSVQPASRWYSGAGIYRHVRLVVTDPVHLAQWGTFITTPKVTASQALVHVGSTAVNQSAALREVTVRWELLAPDGRSIQSAETKPQNIPAGQSADFTNEFVVANPELWNVVAATASTLDPQPSTPQPLYRVSTRILSTGAPVDDELTAFGIRDAHFEPATGFWLNGRNLKIKGVCLHQDAGALGVAVPLRAWERRLALLQQVGCNAIRTAHNPPAPEFLDLCDRMGFLVLDELFDCWTVGKNGLGGERLADYHLIFNEWSKTDVRDTVRRDRNHPSIIAYSAGNEIHDTPNAELAKRILKDLIDAFHKNDPSRPVTQALFRPNVSHDYTDGLADLLDVVGQNYRENEIIAAHEQNPLRKILGTENGHDRKMWLALRDNAPYAGQFLWTGIDYLGESRGWPVIGAGSGLFDRTGAPRPRAFERQSWWSDQPIVCIARRIQPSRATPADPGGDPLVPRQSEFSDWTPRSAGPHDESVEVYSNCEQVELMLNGKSLGTQQRPADASPRTWKVPFEPGTITALGKNKEQVVVTQELRTAGKAAAILLTTDSSRLTPDWDEVAFVQAAIVDQNGVLVPDAADLVSFAVTGPGAIAAVDNGDNSSHELFQASARHAYQGKCCAILKATAGSGQISLTASAPGLKASSVMLQTIAAH